VHVPERLAEEMDGAGLPGAAEHLADRCLQPRVFEHERLLHDPAAVPYLLDLRVQPQVRVAALERRVAERLDLLIEAGADPGDLRLRDPQVERLDDLVDLAGGDTSDVRLLTATSAWSERLRGSRKLGK
jgi:hypothetical protein